MATWTQRTDTLTNVLGAILGLLVTVTLAFELFDEGSGWNALVLLILGPMLVVGFILLFKMLLFPAVGLGVALFRSLRRGVREARTATRRAGLGEAADAARDALLAAGLPAALPASTALTAARWASRAAQRRLRPLALLLVAAVPLILVGLAGYALFGAPGAGWGVITVGAVLAALATQAVPNPDLAVTLLDLAAEAAGAPSPPATRAPPGAPHPGRNAHLRLPRGADSAWTLPAEPGGAYLTVAISAASLPFDATLVAHDQLDAERDDLDTGDRAFDRATLVRPRPASDRADLATAWLTPGPRAVLLRLLALGATLSGGRLSVTLDVRDPSAPAHLAEVLALLDGLAALLARAAGRTVLERAHEALVAAAADAEREALLSECGALADATRADAILAAWAQRGRGPTRVTAAAALTADTARRAALEALVRATDAADDERALALASLAEDDPRAGAEALTWCARAGAAAPLLAAARGHAAALEPAFACALQSGLDKRALPAAVLGPFAWLAVASGAAVDDETLRRWVEAAVDASGAANLEALSALARDPEAARRLATTRLEAFVAGRAGGLSLSDDAPAGQLSLVAPVGES